MNYKNIILLLERESTTSSRSINNSIHSLSKDIPCHECVYASPSEYLDIIYKYSYLTTPAIILSASPSLISISANALSNGEQLLSESPVFKDPLFDETTLSYTRINHTTHLITLQDTFDSYDRLINALKNYMYIHDEQSILALSKHIGAQLSKHSFSITCAESCSGGLIAKRLTDISGASQYFKGGVCTYTAQAKSQLLNIPLADINNAGVVSSQTAQAMAFGVQKLFDTNIALATTGVAGPGPDSDNNPEGLVYIAIALNHTVHVYKYCAYDDTLFLDRDTIRNGCVRFAFEQLSYLLETL